MHMLVEKIVTSCVTWQNEESRNSAMFNYKITQNGGCAPFSSFVSVLRFFFILNQGRCCAAMTSRCYVTDTSSLHATN